MCNFIHQEYMGDVCKYCWKSWYFIACPIYIYTRQTTPAPNSPALATDAQCLAYPPNHSVNDDPVEQLSTCLAAQADVTRQYYQMSFNTQHHSVSVAPRLQTEVFIT